MKMRESEREKNQISSAVKEKKKTNNGKKRSTINNKMCGRKESKESIQPEA
jgi:hypothetical protein